jgi:hypothetical protein
MDEGCTDNHKEWKEGTALKKRVKDVRAVREPPLLCGDEKPCAIGIFMQRLSKMIVSLRDSR